MPIITLSLYWSKISGYNLTSGGLRGKSFNRKTFSRKAFDGKTLNRPINLDDFSSQHLLSSTHSQFSYEIRSPCKSKLSFNSIAFLVVDFILAEPN